MLTVDFVARTFAFLSLLRSVGSQQAPDQVLDVTGPRSNPLFIAQNGIVVMEAESVPIDFPWIFKQSPVDEYTGQGYIRFDGNTPKGGAPMGTMSYYFEIQTPGVYQLVLRTRKIDQVEGHLGNDCYTKLVNHPGYKGENTKTYVSGANNRWITATFFDVNHTTFDPEYTLDEPGIYEFQLSGRSRDFFVDRIVLFDKAVVDLANASRTALPESPRRAFGQSGKLSEITRLLLTTTGNETDIIGEVKQGDVVDFADVGNGLSIVVEVEGFAAEVEFKYDGTIWREGGAPYAMAGNQGPEMNPVPYLSTPGQKTLRTSLYVEGFMQDTRQISFTVVNTAPTMAPTTAPTTSPTFAPTSTPTLSPTMAPTQTPTTSPTGVPTTSPTMVPTAAPTAVPTLSPTNTPTDSPTISPAPTSGPTTLLQFVRQNEESAAFCGRSMWGSIALLLFGVVALGAW